MPARCGATEERAGDARCETGRGCSPARRNGASEVGDGDVPGIGHNGSPSPIDDPEYWHELINEKLAANFLDVTPRFLQGRRQKGGGPPFVRISARCVKYTRFRCKGWYDARLRNSTSDPGEEAA